MDKKITELEKVTIEFNIPKVPGSVNHLYGQARNGRRYIRQEGREYKRLVANIIKKIEVPHQIYKGRLRTRFVISFKDHRKRDLDNCMKILWDSLQGHLFKDDCQIDEYSVKRIYNPEKPGVDITVENIV